MSSRRWFTVGLLLASVAVGGWKGLIPGLDLAESASGGSDPIELAAAFTQAAGGLAVYARTAGTYSGAQISPTSPVRLVWATDTSYCLEGGTAGSELHELGPVGAPAPGPCPLA